MKNKLYLLLFLSALLSCAKVAKEADRPEDIGQLSAPDEFYASAENGNTKTLLDAELNIIWQKDDAVAIFPGNTSASTYVVKKKNAGSTSATLTLDQEATTPGSAIDDNVAFFPASAVTSCSVSAGSYTLNVCMPSVQTYAANSFGPAAMPMVAVTDGTEDHILSMKNLYGALRLKFKGDGYPVRSITFQGNNNEKIAGAAQVSCSKDGLPTINFKNSATTSITLDCGSGIPLNNEGDIIFVIALPPMTFNNGISVTIHSENGEITKTISTPITINRNAVKPISSASLSGFFILEKLVDDSYNEYTPVGLCGSRYTVCLPKGVDVTNLKAVFRTDAHAITVSGTPQESGVTTNNYSANLTYQVEYGALTVPVTVTVHSFDLPAIYIETPGQVAITSKEIWIGNTIVKIWDNTDCGITDLEGGNIKGRGNSTWNRPKKPYALKLNSKKSVLGMNEDKRWNLLANYIDRTMIRNATAFEIARQTGLAWTPSGKFVELILNGEHKGNYYICEHIKLAKKRVNITEMSETDISGEEVTGGYITEITTDDVQEFTTATYHFPVNIKEPDEDVIQPEQIAYLEGYFNTLESILKGYEPGDYRDYIDIDSFIDWWLVFELTMNHEPNNPKSCYMYKDRGGKIFAGPVWDFDWNTFLPSRKSSYMIKGALYYVELFQDHYFVSRLKEKWAAYMDSGAFEGIDEFIDATASSLAYSDIANFAMWESDQTINGDEHDAFDVAVGKVKSAFLGKYAWLNTQITNMVVPPLPLPQADEEGDTNQFNEEDETDW